MDTLNSLDAIHSKMIKMLVETKDTATINGLLDVLSDLEVVIADKMKEEGVSHI
jgi:hypothetical protein